MDVGDSFYIGYISKTRGLKGEMQLFFEFEDYETLELDTLFLEMDRKLVPFFVDSLKMQSNRTAYLFLADVSHIDDAKPLVRKKVYLPNSKKPERGPDDFRITDLKGFTVYDKTHGQLGEIVEVHQYPQQHVAAVMHKGKELMFPLTEQLIVSIDRKSNSLNVDLPDGLVDLYS
jgi:16S rRNA processing protein RimM